LREICIDSDITRQLSGTKVDFMEPLKPLGKIGLIPCLYCSQQPCKVSKEGHFLLGAGTSGYLGGPQKERN